MPTQHTQRERERSEGRIQYLKASITEANEAEAKEAYVRISEGKEGEKKNLYSGGVSWNRASDAAQSHNL